MDNEQLEAFVMAAEVRNLSTAARTLHRSPTSVSRAVSRLERELGVSLFQRGSAGVSLTTEARKLLPLAQEMLRQQTRILDEAAAMRAAPPLSVTLRCASAVPPKVLDAVVRTLEKSSSITVRVDPSLAPSTQLVGEVAAGKVGLAVVHLPVARARTVRTRLLYDYDDMVAMPLDHRLSLHKGIVLSDLAGETVGLTWSTSNPVAVEHHRDRLAAAGVDTVVLSEAEIPELVFGVVQGRWLALPRHPRYGGVSAMFADEGIRLIPAVDPAIGNFRLGLAWRHDLAVNRLFAEQLDELPAVLADL